MDIEAGRLQIDPRKPGYLVDRWIAANWVRHAHARAAVPNNPINVGAAPRDGSVGRGIDPLHPSRRGGMAFRVA